MVRYLLVMSLLLELVVSSNDLYHPWFEDEYPNAVVKYNSSEPYDVGDYVVYESRTIFPYTPRKVLAKVGSYVLLADFTRPPIPVDATESDLHRFFRSGVSDTEEHRVDTFKQYHKTSLVPIMTLEEIKKEKQIAISIAREYLHPTKKTGLYPSNDEVVTVLGNITWLTDLAKIIVNVSMDFPDVFREEDYMFSWIPGASFFLEMIGYSSDEDTSDEQYAMKLMNVIHDAFKVYPKIYQETKDQKIAYYVKVNPISLVSFLILTKDHHLNGIENLCLTFPSPDTLHPSSIIMTFDGDKLYQVTEKYLLYPKF